jgi:hypothetical protein
MFVKHLVSFLIWVSTIFVSFSHNPFSTLTVPLGTNPLNVDESKIVAYLKDNPTVEYNSNVVFVDKDEDYELAHLMGKAVVDVRYRTKPVVSETDSAEEVQAKINSIKSATSIESDEVVLNLLGNMTETIKVSN